LGKKGEENLKAPEGGNVYSRTTRVARPKNLFGKDRGTVGKREGGREESIGQAGGVARTSSRRRRANRHAKSRKWRGGI